MFITATWKCLNEYFGPWEHIHVGRPGRPAIHRQGQQDQDQQYERYIPPPRPSADEAYACRWAVPKLTYAHAARGLLYYRDALDRLTEDQMTWDPYEADLVAAMTPHLLDHQAQWRSRVLLICFEVVEGHLPDRVMRQFGLRQTVPQQCDTSARLHRIDRRGKSDRNWRTEHAQYIDLWHRRLEFVVTGDPIHGVMDPYDPYMEWYMRIIRRFINPSYTPPSAHYHPSFDVIRGYALDMTAMVDALSDVLPGIPEPPRAQVERVRDMGMATLQRYGHAYLVHPRDDHGGHSSHSQFEAGQSSCGGDPSSFTGAEEYDIRSSAPLRHPDDPSSSQLTPPVRPNPFTTVRHYSRRQRPRVDIQDREPLHQIDES
ncbi:serine/threonine-protein phosphatase 7 long form homolog [Chenopodium quinoa]|uniref:serine/threonine-protein phosphatase 7 long form homolog n=1 Tax=Chenopodium quinoa TaxID=63459 RepID=UPI000B784C89|nr:serine/threonine-protein phosphatase 7 long form homolog [Chenopodium quinoa]